MKNKIKSVIVSLTIIVSCNSVFANEISQSDIDMMHKKFEQKFSATFKETTFTNFGPAPITGLFQAEVSNEIIYFAPADDLIIFGEVFDKNGISISAKTKEKWQYERVKNIDLSNVITIGDGPIEIIEFTDTDCPFCQKFDQWINDKNNIYKQENNQDLFTRKIIMTPILQLHPNAAKESIHLLCQNPKNYNKILSDLLNSNISYSQMISCQNGKELLAKHQDLSKKFGVTATPTIIFNDKLIQGFNQKRLEKTLGNILNK